MKPSHKQTIVAFFGASFFTFILLVGKYLYSHLPGPWEKGFEEIKAVFEIFRGSWFELGSILWLLAVAFFLIRNTRNSRNAC